MLHSWLLAVFTAALVNAQGASYAPTLVSCPSTSMITRTGSPIDGTQQLVSEEASYISNRRSNVLPSLWQSYIDDAATGSTGYNSSVFNVGGINYPRSAIAISGGGLRASLYGAGTLSALDSRNSTNAGGLLQLSDYITGLSGGSWIVGSLALNDMPDLFSLVLGLNGETGWLLDMDLLAPGGILSLTVADNVEYYDNILDDVREKAAAGFPVSVDDLWGRALIYHFSNDTTAQNFYQDGPHSAGLQWSSIKLVQNFQAGALPFPIVVSTSRVNATAQANDASDTTVIPLANTQFEISPYTFGSFDPTLQATIPVEYAGTYLTNGSPANGSACVNNFDNAGFVMGTSAALFNVVENVVTDTTFVQLASQLADDIANIQTSNISEPLVANWPNPFKDFAPSSTTSFESANNDILQLTDGGENGENVPLSPLLVKERNIDIILAVDSSADTQYTWPNGTSLITTAARINDYFQGNWSSFPPVPSSPDTFVNEGLNVRPTFFGCNTSGSGNTSTLGNYPLVVYLPNAPPPDVTSSTYFTNTSTFKLDYSKADQVSFLDAAHLNGLKGYPQTGTSDPEWPLCLKCAVVDRARKRARVARSSACEACFDRYCWSPAPIADTLPGGNEQLGSGGAASSSSAATPSATSGSSLKRKSIAASFAAAGAYLV